MHFRILSNGDTRTIKASGEFKFADHRIQDSIIGILSQRSVQTVVFDVSDLNIVHPVGLAILIRLTKTASAFDKTFRVTGVNDSKRRLFEFFDMSTQIRLD